MNNRAGASGAYCWGGVVRSKPSMNTPRLGVFSERQPIVVLGETMNNSSWFKVRSGYMEGYQWGGIICDKSYRGKTYCY